jgi:2-polyprenyl-6-methoxyphenol hydroxylase-like FAD-dependent oxidoreductase
MILIAGAGPTGLTLAIDLARRGVPHRLVDPRRPAGSRGKGLQPRTLEVLDDLGVIDAVRAAGAPYPPLRAYSGADVVWEGRMHEPAEPTPDVPYPNVLMVPQWRTEQILRDRLTALGGRVDTVGLAGFTQDGDGVTADLTDGTTVRAAYLVGADGGRSTVRKALGVPFLGETRDEERMLIGDVRTPDLDRDHWHMWADLETRTPGVGLCPLPGTSDFQFTSVLAPSEDPDLTLATYQRHLADGSGRDDIRLSGLGWASVYRVNIRMAERFRAGRVFLAGDAAHVHSPAGGQGLNTGVQDAYNLGWKLAAGSPSLLDTYEEERLPVAAGVLGISTALYRKAAEGQADAHKRGEETQQLLLAYPDSPLSSGPRGGTRAPNASLADGTTLFDAFRGPHFTLLAFNTPAPACGPAVRTVPITANPEAEAAYGITAPTLVLVRPDGYRAHTGDAASTHTYLTRLNLP